MSELNAIYSDNVREPNDHYPTDWNTVYGTLKNVIVPAMRGRTVRRILDPGAGDTGIWGRTAKEIFWPEAHLIGVEFRPVERPLAFDEWHVGDYRSFQTEPVDLVLGNPPFKFMESFVLKSYEIGTESVGVFFLIRLGWLESMDRYKKLWGRAGLKRVNVMSRRPSFTGNGKTYPCAFSVNQFDKSCIGKTEWEGTWFDYEKVEVV